MLTKEELEKLIEVEKERNQMIADIHKKDNHWHYILGLITVLKSGNEK